MSYPMRVTRSFLFWFWGIIIALILIIYIFFPETFQEIIRNFGSIRKGSHANYPR